ncbi:hypothetical protein D1604_07725 [Brevundimonas sp. LPMIX5]|nr:hypothetical protein D1604_07725 [Brevundimonas sp. LPMIX5]
MDFLLRPFDQRYGGRAVGDVGEVEPDDAADHHGLQLGQAAQPFIKALGQLTKWQLTMLAQLLDVTRL